MSPQDNLPSDDPAADAELQRQLRDSRGLEEPPPHVLQRAYDVWRPRAVPARPRSALRRLLAVLTFDSGGAPALAFGMRSAAASAPRQLLYSADGHDIDLRLQPLPDGGAALHGQLLGPDAAVGRVRLSNDEPPAPWQAETMLDELGGFACAAVPAGVLRLQVELGALLIELPPLQVGAPPARR